MGNRKIYKRNDGIFYKDYSIQNVEKINNHWIINGELKCFKDIGNSGKPVYRKFCGNCGSPIISDVSTAPNLLFIKAGTLNTIKFLRPTKEIWTDHKLDCVTINGIKEKHNTDGK